jgi:hypothetical protein
MRAGVLGGLFVANPVLAFAGGMGLASYLYKYRNSKGKHSFSKDLLSSIRGTKDKPSSLRRSGRDILLMVFPLGWIGFRAIQGSRDMSKTREEYRNSVADRYPHVISQATDYILRHGGSVERLSAAQLRELRRLTRSEIARADAAQSGRHPGMLGARYTEGMTPAEQARAATSALIMGQLTNSNIAGIGRTALVIGRIGKASIQTELSSMGSPDTLTGANAQQLLLKAREAYVAKSNNPERLRQYSTALIADTKNTMNTIQGTEGGSAARQRAEVQLGELNTLMDQVRVNANTAQAVKDNLTQQKIAMAGNSSLSEELLLNLQKDPDARVSTTATNTINTRKSKAEHGNA